MKLKRTLLKLFVLGIVLLPSLVNAESINDVISSKKLSLKSVPINNMDAFDRVNEIINDTYEGYGIDNCNDDYSKCDLVRDGSEVVASNITIDYQFDPSIKTVVDGIIGKIPEEGVEFTLSDIEFISYYLNASEEDDINISTYSGDLRKYIGYKNFTVEPRMGDSGEFFKFQGGTAEFDYNGTKYAYIDSVGVFAKYVVYVNDDETNVTKAIKDRLSKFFSIASVEDTGNSIESYLNDKESEFGSIFDEKESYFEQIGLTKEEYINNMMDSYFNNEAAPCNFLLDAEENIYKINFSNGKSLEVAVIKDSSKVNDNVSLVTTDASSNVTIRTQSNLLPLDTLIKVSKLTSGDEYNKIVNILKVTNSEVFDLKLFSKSLDNYITKLDDGSFEVRIPISDSLKGKNLAVYYVKDDNSIEEYSVTVDGDYAVFTTNHFSIYTLGEKKTAANNGSSQSGTNNNGGESNNSKNGAKTDSQGRAVNPQTGDDILTYIGILILSVTGFTMIYIKKKKLNRKLG